MALTKFDPRAAQLTNPALANAGYYPAVLINALIDQLNLQIFGTVPLNARGFGAEGDGIHDDTLALQRGIDESILQGLALYIPEGVYKVSSSLIWPSNLYLIGAGQGRSIIRLDPAVTASILAAGIGNNVTNSYIRDITFDGAAQNGPVLSTGAALVHNYECDNIVFQNVTFQNGRSYGLGIQGSPTGDPGKQGPEIGLYMENCKFINCGNGKFNQTTLSTSISSSDTSITVANGAIFDASGGTLQIDNEIIKHGPPSGNTIPISPRGCVGTIAASHNAGATVFRLVNGDGIDAKMGLRFVFVGGYAERCGDKGYNLRCKHLSMFGVNVSQCINGIDINAIPSQVEIFSTLNGSITATSNSIILADASSFPTSGLGRVDSETISWSGKSINTLTGVLRGLQGTTAVAHNSGAAIAYDPVDTSQDTYADLVSVSADDCATTGISASTGGATATNYISMIGVSATRNGSFGVALGGAGRGRMCATLDDIKAIANGDGGIRVDSLESFTGSNLICRDNGNNGLHIIDQPNGGSVSDFDLRNNGNIGLVMQGSTDFIRVGTGRSTGNGNGNYLFAGASSSWLMRNIPFSNNQTYEIVTLVDNTWTPGAIANGAFASHTFTFAGALSNAFYEGNVGDDLPDGCFLQVQYVGGGDTLRATIFNLSGAGQNIGLTSLRVIQWRPSSIG